MNHFLHLRHYEFKKSHLKFYLALGIVLFFAAYQLYQAGRFYPNTYVGGVPVSGKTYQQAVAEIKPALDEIKANGFLLSFKKGDDVRIVDVPAAATGFTSDTVVEYFFINGIDKTIQEAYDRGREFPLLFRWSSKLSALFRRKTFEIPYSIHKEAVHSLLDRELSGFLKEPENAEFAAGPGGIVISKEEPGYFVDFDDVIAAMEKSILNGGANGLQFEVEQASPRFFSKNLEPLRDFADALHGSVGLEFRNGPFWWRVRNYILVSWLVPDYENGGVPEIDGKKLSSYVTANVTPSIEGAAVNSRFQMRGGQLVEIAPGKTGLDVDIAKLEEDLEKEIKRIYEEYRSGKMKPEKLAVQMRIERVEPKITKETIKQYQINDLIGRSVTSFAGSSAARIKNIKTGISKFNGVLIAPGEEFSAVEAIGYVNEAEGYEKEYVIKGDRSIKEYGGGLCQIATTLFRLSLDAGLPITERKNHSYVVGYYGPGLDATIYGPHPDVRFVNDTGNYVLFQSYVEGTDLIMEFYGRKDGRRVSISEPRLSDYIDPPPTRYIFTDELPVGVEQCTERARRGLTAEVDYRVEYADSKVNEQTFTSVYTPWAEVCLVGSKL